MHVHIITVISIILFILKLNINLDKNEQICEALYFIIFYSVSESSASPQIC